MKVQFKKLNPKAITPTYGSDAAAGMDLYALIEDSSGEDRLYANETKLIHTGIAAAIPDGYVGLIFARSGLATKHGLAPANKVGVIDSDYRGEIMVALHNHQSDIRPIKDATEGEYDPFYASESIKNGERIAQMVIVPYVRAELEEVSKLDDTNRGAGGFGSTGKN